MDSEDSEDLTIDQAKAIRQSLQGSLSFLNRLQRRMEKAGFPAYDPLFLRVQKAYDAMHALCVDLHYRSRSSGVGKPPKTLTAP